jgi:shikimate dehydrogenase
MPEYRFAVVGDPVAHSRSPAIHRVLLDLTGLEGDYLAVRADAHRLRSLVDELRLGEWNGLNVTMPLKGEAAALADRLSLDAENAGSVNTLSAQNGAVFGDTTDCATFRLLLKDERLRHTGTILVLGAGGSAAAALAAVPPGEAVYVSSRTSDRSSTLSDRLGGEVLPWGSVVAGALVINATPLGMRSERLPTGVLEVASGLIDLPYGSQPTHAVTSARQMGLPVVDGFEFLIRQAMASFRLWTGMGVAYEQVANALRKL